MQSVDLDLITDRYRDVQRAIKAVDADRDIMHQRLHELDERRNALSDEARKLFSEMLALLNRGL